MAVLKPYDKEAHVIKQRQFAEDIAAKLENGMKELYNSDNYKNYLKTIAQFTNYSPRNTMLIHIQCPHATRVAGFKHWEKFGRKVEKGSKAIYIYAPLTRKLNQKELDELEKISISKETKATLVEKGKTNFKLAPVFDVSQTNGKELPQIVKPLEGTVKHYGAFFAALKETSTLPIFLEKIEGNAKGYCKPGEKIAIKDGMSQEQTIKTTIHEIAHDRLHNLSDGKTRGLQELEAESVAYIVCQRFGIDSSGYSFGYLAGWSRHDNEMKDLKASLGTITAESNKIIECLESHFKEKCKNLGISSIETVVEPVKSR